MVLSVFLLELFLAHSGTHEELTRIDDMLWKVKFWLVFLDVILYFSHLLGIEEMCLSILQLQTGGNLLQNSVIKENFPNSCSWACFVIGELIIDDADDSKADHILTIHTP